MSVSSRTAPTPSFQYSDPPIPQLSPTSGSENVVHALPSKYRVAIVGFAGRAYVALPPTDDRDLAVTALRSLHPAQGTSLGDAVALATRIAGRQRASADVECQMKITKYLQRVHPSFEVSGLISEQSGTRSNNGQKLPATNRYR